MSKATENNPQQEHLFNESAASDWMKSSSEEDETGQAEPCSKMNESKETRSNATDLNLKFSAPTTDKTTSPCGELWDTIVGSMLVGFEAGSAGLARADTRSDKGLSKYAQLRVDKLKANYAKLRKNEDTSACTEFETDNETPLQAEQMVVNESAVHAWLCTADETSTSEHSKADGPELERGIDLEEIGRSRLTLSSKNAKAFDHARPAASNAGPKLRTDALAIGELSRLSMFEVGRVASNYDVPRGGNKLPM